MKSILLVLSFMSVGAFAQDVKVQNKKGLKGKVQAVKSEDKKIYKEQLPKQTYKCCLHAKTLKTQDYVLGF